MNKILKAAVLLSFLALFIWINPCMAYELTPEDKERMGPIGIELYKSWTEILGYSALDLVKEMDPAPEIKPGLVITPENAKNYPGLKKIMPDSMYKRLDPNHFLPFKQMTIVKTRPRYYRKMAQMGAKENMGKCKINPDTLMLENFSHGLPFPRNPSALEMIWNQVIAILEMEENLQFDPITCINYNKARKPDSSWKAFLGWYTCQGRYQDDFDPVTHESAYFKGKGILSIGTFFLTYPQDLYGTAFLRFRYFDTNKPDLFMSYLPGMKRIRILSGSDSQDPMVGAEMIWDMWAADWQKQPSKTLFPNDYKLSEPKIMLFPVFHASPSLEIQGEYFITQWEKRPVRILEIISLDPAYVHSKRIMYMDMERIRLLYEEYFDRRGNLWRTWDECMWMSNIGAWAPEGVSILNRINQRNSVIKMNTMPHPDLDPKDFDMRWLTRMAR